MTENIDEKRLSYLIDLLISNKMSDEEAAELLSLFQRDASLPMMVYDQLLTDLLLTQWLRKKVPDTETDFVAEAMFSGNADIDDAFDIRETLISDFEETASRRPVTQPPKKRFFRSIYIVAPIIVVNLVLVLLLTMSLYVPSRNTVQNVITIPKPGPSIEEHFPEEENDHQEMKTKDIARSTSDSTGNHDHFSSAVAVIKEIQNVRWGDEDSRGRQVGDFLDPGWFHMASGRVTLDFFSGASVQLEGECDLHIISPYLVVCQKGRVVSEVSEQAIGFRINTPQIDIIDRGTSFAVDVSGDQTKVNVIQGKVELTGLSSGQVYLEEGEAMAVDCFGNLTSLHDTESEHLELTLASMRKLESRENLYHYESWKEQMAFLSHDPSLVAHFVFENIPTDARVVKNAVDKAVTRDHSASDGFIVQGKITEGRWKKKPALQFGRVSDRMRFSLPGSYDAVTLAAWVRIDKLNQSYNTLFSTFGFAQGEIHWHVYHEGKVAVDINPDNSMPITRIVSDVLIPPEKNGQWIHLGAVLDLNTNRASLYFNGEKKHSERFYMSKPFQFGNCELGNWSAPPLWYQQYPVRSFGGAMDEFLFFSRAFSDEEMQKLATETYP